MAASQISLDAQKLSTQSDQEEGDPKGDEETYLLKDATQENPEDHPEDLPQDHPEDHPEELPLSADMRINDEEDNEFEGDFALDPAASSLSFASDFNKERFLENVFDLARAFDPAFLPKEASLTEESPSPEGAFDVEEGFNLKKQAPSPGYYEDAAQKPSQASFQTSSQASSQASSQSSPQMEAQGDDAPLDLSERPEEGEEDSSYSEAFLSSPETFPAPYAEHPEELSENLLSEREFGSMEENETPLSPADFTPVEFLLCTLEQRSFRKLDHGKNHFIN
jgi:hypothetical protein